MSPTSRPSSAGGRRAAGDEPRAAALAGIAGGVVVADLHEAAKQAQRRALDLQAHTRAVLAASQRTIDLAASGQVGSGRIEQLADEVEGLRRAMETRAVIEQAKGIIIAATGCDADAAFALLAQQSQHENRKLVDVARDLVASKIRPAGQRASGPAGQRDGGTAGRRDGGTAER